MDNDSSRPRYHRAANSQLLPVMAASSTSHIAVSSSISDGVAVTTEPNIPMASTVPTTTRHIDFGVGAKAYKHQVLKQSVFRGVVIGVYIIAFVTVLTAATGIYINNKYAGRALPFSYIGTMSVGGLNESQIKSALDEKLKTMSVTFIDGGLQYSVPVSQFSAKADTAAAAYEATHTPFNPFAYLNKRQFEVSAAVNDRQIDGYIATVVNRSKTISEDARLVVEKKKLKIVPETQGFRTKPDFVKDQIKRALSTMEALKVNVNIVTIKPNVYATDLEDDLTRANAMIDTNVALQYNNTVIKPTAEEKQSWIQVSSVPGASNVHIGFSRALVRQYVITQANKFQSGSAKLSDEAARNALTITPRGTVIDNIDEATDGIIDSLLNTKPYTQKLTSKIGTYNRLVTAN